MNNNWIVIEGDNGTGKDTLAQSLGLTIVNYRNEIREAEKQAKALQSGERFQAFLRYNQRCAETANALSPAVVIRYWPSTLAGAFADKQITEQEFQTELERLKDFPKPGLLVLLRCQFQARVQRILDRNVKANGKLHDNTQEERSIRHWTAMQAILEQFPKHVVLDNTWLSCEETQAKLHACLQNYLVL